MIRSAAFALVLTVATAVAPGTALAERTPDQGPEDGRIRTIVYNPRDVVKVVGHYGYHTLIELAEGENVETILIGDSVAWQVIPTKRGNVVAVKPAESNAATNLTLITDRRTYAFSLEAKKGAPGPQMTWRLQFRYPEDESAAQLAELAKTRLANVASGKPDVAAGPEGQNLNFRYTYAGDATLAPELAFDDGEFTYFRFAKDSPLPGIFVVDAEKRESMVDQQIVGDYVQVKAIGTQFSLRAGEKLTCVFNEKKDEKPQAEPITKTLAQKSAEPGN